jgi:hypothetical protein
MPVEASMCRKNVQYREVQPLGTKHMATSCKNQGQRTTSRSSLNLLSPPKHQHRTRRGPTRKHRHASTNAQAPAPNKKTRKVTSCGKKIYKKFVVFPKFHRSVVIGDAQCTISELGSVCPSRPRKSLRRRHTAWNT